MQTERGGSGGVTGKDLAIWLDRAETGSIAIFAGVALVVAVYKMAMRYLYPALDPDWGDEIVVYLTIWAALIACGSLVRLDGHIYADLVVRLLPARLQSAILLAVLVCSGCLTAFLAYYGFQMSWEAWVYDDVGFTSLQFPMALFYLALPVGAVLMTVNYVRRVVACLRRFGEVTFGGHADLPAAALPAEPADLAVDPVRLRPAPADEA